MIRLDYLPDAKDIKIYQDDEIFRINTDTHLLGKFIDIHRKDVVLDIGTNTGALMLYASLFDPKRLVGIDINEKALEIAEKNMKLNNVKNYELIYADGNTFKLDEEVDVIIFNPPYFKTKAKDLPNNHYLSLAKHEDNFSLDAMIECLNRNVRVNGKLFFLFTTSRLMEVLPLLASKKLIVKVLKFVYDINKQQSNVVLIKAVKGAKEGLIVEKPIIIDRKRGQNDHE